jgi:hypothetical protein
MSVLGFLLLLSPPSTLHAQPAPPPNRVLQLDGQAAHVQLPGNMFTNLDEATIECWVRIEEFNSDARVFDFGENNHEVYLAHDRSSPDLRFLITDPRARAIASTCRVPGRCAAGVTSPWSRAGAERMSI